LINYKFLNGFRIHHHLTLSSCPHCRFLHHQIPLALRSVTEVTPGSILDA